MAEVAASVPGISRILYYLTAKPPATTEWEQAITTTTLILLHRKNGTEDYY